MYLFVEIWKPKASWLALTPTERGAYFESFGPVIQAMVNDGLDIIGWSINDADTPNSGSFTYFAAYRIPTLALVQQFEATVEGSGWYNYFEQVNARGLLMGPPDVLQQMAML
jgi:hypothetical protein